MENNKLELRMYGLVNYQLSPIQKGIQFSHALAEYSLQHYGEEYIDWAQNWKTVIVLNGGTTNSDAVRPGTLNLHAQKLAEMNLPIACFYEPDLGDQLTAVAFIADERVWDFEKYPDFDVLNPDLYDDIDEYNQFITSDDGEDATNIIFDQMEKWAYSIGGHRNYKLREYLKNFNLAQ